MDTIWSHLFFGVSRWLSIENLEIQYFLLRTPKKTPHRTPTGHKCDTGTTPRSSSPFCQQLSANCRLVAQILKDLQSIVASFAPSLSAQALLLDEHKRGFCGGTILNEYVILTAAHCMNQSRYIYVRLGNSQQLLSSQKQQQQQFIVCLKGDSPPFAFRGV